MAIIAVALAPQVMKWVDSSRISTDNNNRATLKNSIDAAIADYMGDNGDFTDGKYVKFKINSASAGASGIDTTGSNADEDVIDGIIEKVVEVLNGQYPDVKQDDKGYFFVEIDDNGSVTVTVRDENGAVLSGEDL